MDVENNVHGVIRDVEKAYLLVDLRGIETLAPAFETNIWMDR